MSNFTFRQAEFPAVFDAARQGHNSLPNWPPNWA